MNISTVIRASIFASLSLLLLALSAESKPLKLKNSNRQNAVLKQNLLEPAILSKTSGAKLLSAKSAKSPVASLTSQPRSPISKSVISNAASASSNAASASLNAASASSNAKNSASASLKRLTSISADKKVQGIINEILERILANDINAKTIAEDAKNSVEYTSSFKAPSSTTASSEDPSTILSRLWTQLKRDFAWETEAMKEEFEKLEEAILRRIQSIIHDDDDDDENENPNEMFRTGKMHIVNVNAPHDLYGDDDDDYDDDDDLINAVETEISPSKLKVQRDQHEKQQRRGDEYETSRVTRHVGRRIPPRALSKEIEIFFEKKARRKGAKGRGKRNLLTDLIRPHMRWDEKPGPSGGTTLTYQQFRVIAGQLVAQLKIDRQLVTGAERETANAIISALEDLLAMDEAKVTELLQS